MANEKNTQVKGKKKMYEIDHKIIIDPETGRELARGERNDKGGRIIETSNPQIQEKLQKLGYSEKGLNRKMFVKPQKPNPGVISQAEAERRRKG